MRTTIDRAGRVVIPKAIRERQHLEPGTEIEVIDTGDRIELILPDDRERAQLTEKDGRLVISAATGRAITLKETLAIRDELREGRGR
jgi:AbrB family looped-hinge helix DNA binding protein